MIVPVRCDRCRQTAEEAGTEIDGICGNCAQDLHDEWQAFEAQERYDAFTAAGYEPAGVGYTENF